MTHVQSSSSGRPRPGHAARLIWVPVLALLAACSTPSGDDLGPAGIRDPLENVNRSVHKFNKDVDTAFLRPLSIGYTTVLPDVMEDSVVYFNQNLSMPKVAINGLLQADLKTFVIAIARFGLNSTIGGLGLSDPATEFGLPAVDADFGETLHVWGLGEGAYLELPFFGPSTVRDAVGKVVDIGLNPFSYIGNNPLGNAKLGTDIASVMTRRGRFLDTVDSVLYESADSYTQSQLIYLQNRRFELGGTTGGNSIDAYRDPYDDPYADPYQAPYDDPYEDPYASQ
ncbi:MAG: MlaA family lipoprotein [Marinibacterium sp.]